jgi:Fur family ferric uptake transcriptional regulator
MTQALSGRPDLLATLEDRGYRVTAPRRSVTGLLERSQEGLSAEEICQELPGVGRATVYRTLKLLQDTGVLCKLPLPDGAPVYTLARVEHHHHTICMKCGVVGEFRHATIERLLRAIGEDIPGELVGHRIEAYILCEKCVAGPGA